MALNRFIAGLLVLGFNIYVTPEAQLWSWKLWLPLGYILAGGVIVLWLMLQPNSSNLRRFGSLLLDNAALSIELHIGGSAAVWLFGAYLWTISGYGYRFGLRFQVYAMLVATLGFCAMAATTSYWRGQPSLTVAGVICLSIVPLYALALISNLSKARRQAEDASRAKSLFLTRVSHELRTPLNAVIGMGVLLEGSGLTPDQRQMNRTILTAAKSLLALINGLLDMSSIESGQINVAQVDFKLLTVLEEIRSIFAMQASAKGVGFNLHVTARTPLQIYGDARKLHEILLNLTGNAIKFTESGHITVAADMVIRPDVGARLRFEVSDTGIGIVPEAQERIFEMFTQADETVVNRFGGTGLGLALVRKSVEILGGEVGVNSVSGQGSCFWFEVPFRVIDGPSEVPKFNALQALVPTRRSAAVASVLGRLNEMGVNVEPLSTPLPGWPTSTDSRSICVLGFDHIGAGGRRIFVDIRQGPTSGLPDLHTRLNFASVIYLPADDAALNTVLRVVADMVMEVETEVVPVIPSVARVFSLLVADDNATNRHVIERILRAAGHKVTLVNNGEEALDMMIEQQFDAAILDVNMPLLDGIEAAKHYRMSVVGQSAMPLIALTADATSITRSRCEAAGMAACLVKPVEPAQLLTVIDELVGVADAKHELDPATRRKVTEITTHPKFRGTAADSEVLSRLHRLGGLAFVHEVCDLFNAEANVAVKGLRAAVASGDVAGFRTNAHALRSVAANVGAQSLCDILRPGETISELMLRDEAPAWLERISSELTRTSVALAAFCSRHDAQAQQ